MADEIGNQFGEKGIFVTGTDTGVGKTLVASALIKLLTDQNRKVVGMKPIASGCELIENEWQNEDALALIAAGNVKAPYKTINPYAFEPAIAPHLAASSANIVISIDKIIENYLKLKKIADSVVVEGAGGWLVPINKDETMADLALEFGLPVVLVVGLRLGCINHAMLSVQSIHEKGLKLLGWVANSIDPLFEEKNANIETLKERISAPCLGVIPHDVNMNKPENAAEKLKLRPSIS